MDSPSQPLEGERNVRGTDPRDHEAASDDQTTHYKPTSRYDHACSEKMRGTDPQVTPEFIPSGHVRVTGDFVGICIRPVHAQDGDIQCFKHRLWRSSRIHRTVVTAVTFVLII